ncbi:MAG: 50S ribosomal protein L32 [Chitinophagales bacterium]|nr:50S ribosomal protein L32 [Chitinophagales bacterium]
MAHPKRKISQIRRDKRRTHYKLTPRQFVNCSNCGQPTRLHHVCGNCGYYRGKLAMAVKAATTSTDDE